MTMHTGAHEGTGPSFRDDLDDDGGSPSGPLDEIRNGIKAFLDVGIQIGQSVDRHQESIRTLLARLEKNTPVVAPRIASGVYPASGNLILNMGSPDQGTYWEVQSVAVGGTDYNVTAAGSAALYVCGFLPTPTNSPGITSMVDYAPTLPNAAFYGGKDIVVNDQEYLALILFSGTSSQTYAANAKVAVFNVAAARGSVETTT